MFKIGIDVGGTNTDAVIINEDCKIIAKTKQATTNDISTGIAHALKNVIDESNINKNDIGFVMLGTTHCTNALIERKNLNRIAHIRIGSPAAKAISPLPDWSEDLMSFVGGRIFHVNGGFEFDGRPIQGLDEQEIVDILKSIKGKIDAISVAGIFSKIDSSQELRVLELVHEILGEGVSVSLSHQIGGLGLLERENATVVNALLVAISSQMVIGFKEAVEKHDLTAEIFISQNDGTLMSLDQARKFPVLTISSGPTNSLRGAGALSGLDYGIVIDVGGTTSDAGILINGFPRESNKHSDIGGVRTNFRMPDIISVGLGGGTIIQYSNGTLKVGPQSVGYKLTKEAMCFGGNKLTLTDLAIFKGRMQINKANLADSFDGTKISEEVEKVITEKIENMIDMLKTEAKNIPVILVGGGSKILPSTFKGASSVVTTEHYEVANAYGVAIAQISGESESVVNLTQKNRDDAIKEITEKASMLAIVAGAKPKTIKVADISDIPLAYLPNTTKIKVKVYGDLN